MKERRWELMLESSTRKHFLEFLTGRWNEILNEGLLPACDWEHYVTSEAMQEKFPSLKEPETAALMQLQHLCKEAAKKYSRAIGSDEVTGGTISGARLIIKHPVNLTVIETDGRTEDKMTEGGVWIVGRIGEYVINMKGAQRQEQEQEPDEQEPPLLRLPGVRRLALPAAPSGRWD